MIISYAVKNIYISDPKFNEHGKSRPENNYFFELQCLNRFFAGAAMLGTAVIALIYIRNLAAAAIATTGIVMMGYSTYSFFTRNNRPTGEPKYKPESYYSQYMESDGTGLDSLSDNGEAVLGLV